MSAMAEAGREAGSMFFQALSEADSFIARADRPAELQAALDAERAAHRETARSLVHAMEAAEEADARLEYERDRVSELTVRVQELEEER